MAGQILHFVYPEFSDVIEMTGHFFYTTRKEILRDAPKALERVQITFK